MSKLTLFVMRCGDENKDKVDRAVGSFSSVYPVVRFINTGDDFSKLRYDTEFCAFVHSNEYCNNVLKDALPLYLELKPSQRYDILSFYKMESKEGQNPRYFSCPRIFHYTVPLKSNSIEPLTTKGYHCTHILDGLLVED